MNKLRVLNGTGQMRAMNSKSNFFLIFLIALFGVVLLRTAWMCDDAYITLRTVDNFVFSRVDDTRGDEIYEYPDLLHRDAAGFKV